MRVFGSNVEAASLVPWRTPRRRGGRSGRAVVILSRPALIRTATVAPLADKRFGGRGEKAARSLPSRAIVSPTVPSDRRVITNA